MLAAVVAGGHIRRHLHRHHCHLILNYLSTTTTAANSESTRPSRPPPIRVMATESAGRGVFATRNIAAGELIHTAKPLVTHPSISLLHEVCYNCLRRRRGSIGEQMMSSGDYYVCSESCKANSKVFHDVEKSGNWSLFDEYCRSRGLKYPFMVKRLACMVISGVLPADSLDILQPANLSPEALLQMEDEFKLLECSFKEARIQEELIAFLTKQWYINVLARIRINAFRIELVAGSYDDLLASAAASVESDVSLGNAVYMMPSFYNHDCDPNTHIVWIDNSDAKLKALCDIEAGEELRICYIDASMGFDARQKILSEGFGFKCRCLRCFSRD